MQNMILVAFVSRDIECAIMSHARIDSDDVREILGVWEHNILAFEAVVLIIFKPRRGVFVGLAVILVIILKV